MRLRPHRRNLVVWSSSAGPAHRYHAPRFTRLTRASRIRRFFLNGALLAVIGLIGLARAVRPRWRPLLAGGVLTVVGVVLRSGAGGVALLPGLLFLLYGLLMPASPEAARVHSELERELAVYSTPAQRRDLEATLDRYPDGITQELREILAGQAMNADNTRSPTVGRY
jgi:hypothetical protein